MSTRARKTIRLKVAGALAALGLTGAMMAGSAQADSDCSVWLVENSRFMNVPFGAFMPDRTFVPGSTDPMNNINMIDHAGQRRRDQVRQGADPVRQRLEPDRLSQDDGHGTLVAPVEADRADRLQGQPDVSKIVIGHGHWDHAGQPG